jgi:hypothetical protein
MLQEQQGAQCSDLGGVGHEMLQHGGELHRLPCEVGPLVRATSSDSSRPHSAR